MADTAPPDEGKGYTPLRKSQPDAHGQAALLLAEAILHQLIEAGALTLGEAVNAVRTAAEVKLAVAEESDEASDVMIRSLGLLRRIEQTLRVDDPERDPSLRLV